VDELTSSPPRRSGRLQRRSTARESSPDGSNPSRTLASPKATSPGGPYSGLSDLGSPEVSDDDDVVMVTKPAARRKSRLDMDDPFIVNNDDLEFLPDKPGRKGRASRGRSQRDDFVVDDDEVEYISSENKTKRDKKGKKRPNRGDDFIVDDDDDIESLSSNEGERMKRPSPAKSQPRSSSNATPKKRRTRTQEEQDELNEDLRDLRGSDSETPQTKRRRTRGGPVTTKRDEAREHLELLKRRRAGEQVARVIDSDDESSEEKEAANIDYIGVPDYDLSNRGSVSTDQDEHARTEDFEEEGIEDDFIDDDSQGRLGRPNTDIPLQFTSFATKKPKELFIHIIEWLVKNKIAPAFDRNDPVYDLAFAKVDDQVKAQAGSRLISSAWGSHFKYAILARPSMTIEALPGEDDDHIRTCDACNRVNNPARYEFIFSGEPYYKKTLEPIENPDEDDEQYEEGEDDDDHKSIAYDEVGHVIASSQTRFYLGRFCAANAQMGHKLTHWKYNLNVSLMEYLESQGVLSAEAIIAREKMNKRKREKEAENVVDEMEATGKIEEFWHEFGNDLDDARIGMEDFEKKGGRTKGRVGTIQAKRGGFITTWDRDTVRTAVEVDSDSEGE
jgi:hypothetical protein